MNLLMEMLYSIGGTSDFNPPSSGLMFDLNTPRMKLGDGAVTSTWTDYSGNNNHALSVGNAVNYPAIINGCAALDLSASKFNSPSLSIGVRTYYMVVQMKNTTSSIGSLIYQDSTPYSQLYLPNSGNINLFINSTVYSSGLTWSTGQPLLIKAEVNTTTNQITVNGVSGPLFTHTAISAISQPFMIGYAGTSTPVFVGRALLYNRIVSEEDDLEIQAGLKKQFKFMY